MSMTTRVLLGLALGAAIGLGLAARESRAQGVVGTPYMSSYRVSDYFVGPGWYGTSYGFASYGFPQSVGCVETPISTAAQIWPYTPVGTLVTIAP